MITGNSKRANEAQILTPLWILCRYVVNMLSFSLKLLLMSNIRLGEDSFICILFYTFSSYLLIIQGRSEGTSSATFEVPIINCQIYFINLFIFNCLTLNIKLLIFKLFDVKFLFSESHVFRKHNRTACLWSYGRVFLVSDFKLTRENDGLFFET